MSNQTSQQPAAPVALEFEWRANNQLDVSNAYLANWLMDTGSLTERLQSMCRHFTVEVLFHAQIAADTSSDSEANYLREVILWGDGVPWVFARSIIPAAINNGELLGLGEQPLGQRIFNDERFVRSQFEMCRVARDTLCASLPSKITAVINSSTGDNIKELYGRRSAFHFLDHQLSVAEIFLPQAPAYSHG